jgi:predicted nucleic acid-binding protein
MTLKGMMYLLDTNVLSEIRKRKRTNKGVTKFFKSAIRNNDRLFVSVITIGELRRGVELIRHRGDNRQAKQLEKWLDLVINEYQDNILDIDQETAQVWGKLRSPHPEHALDKLIAATAMTYGLTVVTRNEKDFKGTGAKLFNPFE